MLHLIFGRAGSGKTKWARDFLAGAGGKAPQKGILLVPEQNSFESERAMLRLMGAQRAQTVLVTSFTRLSEQVFRAYGGIAGRRLKDGGRAILMQLALEELGDRLTLFRRGPHAGELVQLMLGAAAECKMCAISPDMLAQAAGATEDGVLRQKLMELSLLLGAYEALVGQSYLDPQDDLTRMRALLDGHDFFAGATVVVDSFAGFTVQEKDVLRRILRQAKDVYVTLCADGLAQREGEAGLFAAVKRTAAALLRMAREEGVPAAPPVTLPGGARFASPALACLEAQLFRADTVPCEGGGADVFLFRGESVYEEAEFAASQIRELVRAGAYRYRDFAVIVRTPETYRGSLDVSLEKRDIPYFMDRPKTVDAEPLMCLALSAFRIVTSGYSSEAVFSYLKTGLAGLSSYEISLLENYTYVWGLTGRAWIKAWEGNPNGFRAKRTPEEEAALAEINALRARVVAPLQAFERALEGADGEGCARAVYELLTRLDVQGTLPGLCARLDQAGRAEYAREQLRLWELLMGVLDQTALVLRGRVLGTARYAELLRMVIEAEDISDIPQGLDEVTVGAADRMRPAAPKVTFLLGAVRGEFPLAPSDSGVFSDRERRTLQALGLALNRTAEEAAIEERFVAYSAVASASHRLYITWAPNGGEACYPSEIVEGVRAVLPALREWDRRALPPDAFANAAEPAFALCARLWHENTPMSAALKAFFETRPEEAARLGALRRIGERGPVRIEDQGLARALFGSGHRMSATQVETYHMCRFRYFCRFGMGVRERRAAQIDALEYGSLMHFLLERLFSETGCAAVSAMEPSALRTLVRRLISQYADECFGGEADKPDRFVALLDRLADSACVLLSHVARELRQSRFQPVRYELEIGGDEAPALRIPLPRGGYVSLVGKIDRVDVMEQDGVRYVRVIDYKTGRKEFRLSDILYGLNLQMLIYLAALIEDGHAKPAGVLYMPSLRPSVSAGRGETPEAIAQKADKELRMKGVVLADETVVRGMDAEAAGRYIPVSVGSGGLKGREYLLSEAEFAEAVGYIKNKVSMMAQTLQRGDIEPAPLLQNHFGCDFCPYFAVCGREYAEQDVVTESIGRDEVLREIGEEGKRDA